MKADPSVIADLQTACGYLATIAEQYRVDGYQIRHLGLDDMGHRFYPKWHQCIEDHLNRFIKRLLNFEANPAYQVGPVTTGADLRALVTQDLTAVERAFGAFCVMRKNAWNVRADGVTDLYEHAIQTLEHQVFKLEQQMRLISGLGLQNYIGAILEDD